MIELLLAKRANATNIRTIATINAIIFQHATLESIDTTVDAFHSVATIVPTKGFMQTHVGYIWFLKDIVPVGFVLMVEMVRYQAMFS